uniref:Uncharacterized protein n=1 Tax=Lactuca sativa TaxID=4236 RepID=A0A9R1WM44_LACSA|nr:hypothetical protein LSAT_V11C100030260 [Lactuca sativa]
MEDEDYPKISDYCFSINVLSKGHLKELLVRKRDKINQKPQDPKNLPQIISSPHSDAKARDVLETNESEVEEFLPTPKEPDIKVLLGTDLDQDIKLDLIKFLKDIKSTFARKHEAMPEKKNRTYKELDHPRRGQKIAQGQDDQRSEIPKMDGQCGSSREEK